MSKLYLLNALERRSSRPIVTSKTIFQSFKRFFRLLSFNALQATGTLYFKRHSQRTEPSDPILYNNILFRCVHHGQGNHRGTKRRTQTLKMGCGSQVTLVASGGKLVVGSFEMKHSHWCSDFLGKHYKRNRQPTGSTKEYIENVLPLKPDTAKRCAEVRSKQTRM